MLSCIFQLSTSQMAANKGKDHSKGCDKISNSWNMDVVKGLTIMFIYHYRNNIEKRDFSSALGDKLERIPLL